jgi:Spy/CpxP family protein refolding chaperone
LAANPVSPYAGQEQRPIKALSKASIEGYLGGKGMGYAKAAELNGYPGPKHVLELGQELKLTEHQLRETTRLFESMQKRAIELGGLLVQKERDLDHAFASNAIDSDSLRALLEEIADLEGELRYVHLEAHLRQKELLSSGQSAQYQLSRGYDHHAGKH